MFFVVDETGNFAVNIEKAETIKLVLNKVIKKYCIVFDNFDGTNPSTAAAYETHEAAKYAFYLLISAMQRDKKVFFMPSNSEAELRAKEYADRS